MHHTHLASRVRLAIGLAAASVSPVASCLEPVDIFQKNQGSVGVVSTPISLGSGVVIAPQTVLTNCHVVAGAKSDIAFKQAGHTYPALLVAGNTAFDLCKLTVPGLAAPAVTMRKLPSVRVGERVYAIGNPRGLELTLSEGLVSGLRDIEDDRQIQTTAPISPGSSGGGLFDDKGRLLGITTSTLANSQNLNFAMPASLASQLQPLKVVDKFEESGLLTPAKLDKLADLVERQDFDGMQTEATHWIQTDGPSAFALTLAGMTIVEFDQFALGEKLLSRAMEIRPQYPPTLYAMANLRALQGIPSSGAVYLKQCAEVAEVGNSLMGAYRALCRAKLGDLTSIQALQAYIDENPRSTWLPQVQALAYLLLKDGPGAQRAAKAAVLLNRSNALAHLALALSLTMQHQPDEAVAEIEQATAISPKSPLILQVGTLVMVAARRLDDAKSYYSRLSEVSPSRAKLLKAQFSKAF